MITAGDLLPITLQRNGKLDVVLGPDTWQPGDTITYLMHDPTPQLLKRLSGGKRTGRLVTDTLPSSQESSEEQPPAETVTEPTDTSADGDITDTAEAPTDKPSGNLQKS